MATAANLVPLDEYLQHSYSPDCEYIDGVILERNVGQGKHAFTQSRLLIRLTKLTEHRSLLVLVEQRTRVAPSRVRIPDVCVVQKLEEVISEPPLLCVEVLSPDDRWARVNATIADYQAMGVSCVWVVNPYESRAWIFELDTPPAEVKDGKLTAQMLSVEVLLADVLPPAA